jgi:DNA (cytosine-5)-methyltransferase 1
MILLSGDVRTPDIRDAERLQGFVAGWTKAAEAVQDVSPSIRWKLIGNAVTVNVAEWIGSRILKPGVYDGTGDRPLKEGAAWPKAAWYDGKQRCFSSASPWPVERKSTPLEDFLKFRGKDLSARATEGFLSRVRKSPLRRPDGFDAALEAHLERMKAAQELERLLKNSTMEMMKSAPVRINGADHGNGNGNGNGRTGGGRPHVRANVAGAPAGHRS